MPTFSRHFISEAHLTEHLKSKLHKRRLKKLEDEPYTQEEVLSGEKRWMWICWANMLCIRLIVLQALASLTMERRAVEF